jgi:ankyrin repeat protein
MTGPHWAAKANTKVEIIHFPLDNGAEIDAKDQKCLTPLHYAAWNNSNPQLLSTLLEAGADINATSSSGKTVLFTVESNPNVEVLKFLLDQGLQKRQGGFKIKRSNTSPPGYYMQFDY